MQESPPIPVEGSQGGTTDQTGIKPDTTLAKKQQTWFNLPYSYWVVLAALVLFSLANSSDTFLLLRARDLGYSPWAIVLVYALYNVTYSAISYPIGVLSDKIGRCRIIAIGWLIYAIVYALTGLTTFIASLLVGIVWDYYGSTAALMIGAGFAILALLGLAITHRFVAVSD